MGTGTFLNAIIERAATQAADIYGSGVVPQVITDLAKRLIGFELQMGSYAVAEMRVADLLKTYNAIPPKGGMRLYVTNTLDDPFIEETQIPEILAPIARSRHRANQIKANTPVTVVIGNPPYDEHAQGKGGWVENGTPDSIAPLHRFHEEGNGKLEYVLKSFYVYFYAWATWKVFDAHPNHRHGVVAFITTAGYLTGPGFKGMRRYLRATCSEGWIINVSPERGAQPDVPTRLFPGVQRKLAIGIFVREAGTDTATPAVLHYTEVVGRRDAKYAQLGELKIDDSNWQKVRDGWDAPFTPGAESWDDYPALGDLFPWVVPGIKANRTWVYAPAPAILQKRWTDLITEKDPKSKSKKLKKTDDRDIDSSVLPLPYGNQHGRRTAQSGPPTSRRSSPNCWHGTNRRLGAAAAPAASLKRPPDPRPVRHGAREASTCSSAPAAPTTGAAPMASATFTRPPTAGTPTASTGQPGRCSSTPVRRSPASLSRRGPPPFPGKSSRPPRAGELPGLPATP
jgi:predicted helicase